MSSGDYGVVHNNTTNFYRNKNEGNVECKLKLVIHKNGCYELLDEDNTKVPLVPKKSFVIFDEMILDKFTAIQITDKIKESVNYIHYPNKENNLVLDEDEIGLEINISSVMKSVKEVKKEASSMVKSSSVYDIEGKSPPSPKSKTIKVDKLLVFKEFVDFMAPSRYQKVVLKNGQINVFVKNNFSYVFQMIADDEIFAEVAIDSNLEFEKFDEVKKILTINKSPPSKFEKGMQIYFESSLRGKIFVKIIDRIQNYYIPFNLVGLLLQFSLQYAEEIKTTETQICINDLHKAERKKEQNEIYILAEICRSSDDKSSITVWNEIGKCFEKRLNVDEDLIEIYENKISINNLRFTFLRNNDAFQIYNKMLKIGMWQESSYFSCFCQIKILTENMKIKHYYGKLFILKYKDKPEQIIHKISNSITSYSSICIPNCFATSDDFPTVAYYNYDYTKKVEFHFSNFSQKEFFFQALNRIQDAITYRQTHGSVIATNQ